MRSKRLFEAAVRDHCSKMLVSVTLCSEPLYSALLCSVHGYARVHTSISIQEVLVQRGVLGPSTCLRDRSPQVPPGRSKWLFGPALVLPVHSKRLLGLLESDSVPPGRSKCLKKAQKCSKRRKEAQKGARKGCSSLPGGASAPEEAVRACFGAACAFEEAVRDCCSRSLFKSAGLGFTLL